MNIGDIFTIEQYDEAYEFVTTHEYTAIEDLGDGTYQIIQLHIPTPEEEAEAEKQRIAMLHLTKREVFLGLHKAKQVTPDMIKAKITEPEALIEFEYATEYYRGNPLIDMVGEALGITPNQLDRFFETNDYLYLTSCTLTINPIPVEATVTINDVIENKATVPFSTTLVWSVSMDGYKPQNGRLEIGEDTEYNIILEKEELPNEDTTNKQSDINADETTIKEDIK